MARHLRTLPPYYIYMPLRKKLNKLKVKNNLVNLANFFRRFKNVTKDLSRPSLLRLLKTLPHDVP